MDTHDDAARPWETINPMNAEAPVTTDTIDLEDLFLPKDLRMPINALNDTPR